MRKVLIVDDEVLNREFLAKVLHKECFVVLEATHGQEALDILSKRRVDLIIMDINMPVMGGDESIAHIRNVLQLQTPIIAISGSCEQNIEVTLKELGANYYLKKPYTLVQLLDIITSL